MTPIPARAAERAATRYVTDGGCWVSTYSVASHGYAQVGWREGGKNYMTTAHRAAWTHHHGPIPEGLTVDHDKSTGCRFKTCVNPTHLRLLTNLANASDNRGASARGSAVQVEKVCRVHNERKWQTPTGAPFCRACARKKWARRKSPTRQP